MDWIKHLHILVKTNVYPVCSILWLLLTVIFVLQSGRVSILKDQSDASKLSYSTGFYLGILFNGIASTEHNSLVHHRLM